MVNQDINKLLSRGLQGLYLLRVLPCGWIPATWSQLLAPGPLGDGWSPAPHSLAPCRLHTEVLAQGPQHMLPPPRLLWPLSGSWPESSLVTVAIMVWGAQGQGRPGDLDGSGWNNKGFVQPTTGSRFDSFPRTRDIVEKVWGFDCKATAGNSKPLPVDAHFMGQNKSI